MAERERSALEFGSMTTAAYMLLRPLGYVVRILWAGLLMIFGLFMIDAGGSIADPVIWFGVAFFGAGQFLSMVLVANRLCPPRSSGLAIGCELLAAVVFLGALFAGCALFLAGVWR